MVAAAGVTAAVRGECWREACKIVPMVDQLQSVSVSVSGDVSVSGSVREHHWVTGVDGERKRKMKFFRCSKNSFQKILKKSR